MEVKPGYKQTEVGVIPQEWEITTVGAMIADGIIEKPMDGNHGNIHPKSGDFVSWGIPFVMANNVQNGRVDLENCSFIRKQQADYLQKGFSISGDVLLTHKATVGNTAVVGELAFPYIMLTPQVTYYRVKDKNRLSNIYLRHYFDTASFQAVLRAFAGGGTRSYIGISAQHQLPVVLPANLPEQRAISEALSDVDGLLGGLDRLIAKKRDLKQAAMQQLLTGQTRLPGFSGDWEVKALFELAGSKKELFNDGDWIESEHITNEGIRLIQTGNIGVGCFIEKDDKKYINEESFTSLRCKQLKQGDLLICRLADPAGRACVLGEIGEERIVTSVDVTIFRPKSELADRRFLAQVFSTPDWFRAVSDRSGGTTHKRISRGALGRLSIKIPSSMEQTSIAEVLTDMDAEIAALEARRDKTRALKQAMMQELLTGRIRLV